VLEDQSTTAAAYVAMTRGRQANTAHLVAADIAQPREQWLTTLGRDRADLGPAAARHAAERDAARYLRREPRPGPEPVQIDPPVPVPQLRVTCGARGTSRPAVSTSLTLPNPGATTCRP
jgi:exodeoxyribonuclease V alpha subunit